jgi:acyl-CoA thioesterase-2
MTTTAELINLIELKQIDKFVFEGRSHTVGSPNVFGGQVLAQALNAACRTLPTDRYCHSLHAYFVLHGDLEKPIQFKVMPVRDGGSFTTRFVSAEQDSKTIFVLAASFQKQEIGYDYQEKMPEAPPPEGLLSWKDIYEQSKGLIPEKINRFLGLPRPITFKPTVIHNPFEHKDLPPKQQVWFKFNEINNQISEQHFIQLLAYASDYNILMTALQPHASEANFGNTQMASLDHAIWFHRKPDDYSDWFLFSIDVESNSNARGLTLGKIFDQKGKLLASVTQEGLIRKIKPKK